MGKKLVDKGLRTCCLCKKVLPLTATNFYSTTQKNFGGFGYRCRPCSAIRSRRRYQIIKNDPAHIEKYKNRIVNQERQRELSKNRRLKLRFEVLLRFNFTCQYCGRKAPEVTLHVDHIFPKSKGGKSAIENYTVACLECNYGKGDSILTEFMEEK